MKPNKPSTDKIDEAVLVPRGTPWTKEEDSLLGTLSDRNLAIKLNRNERAVRWRRESLKVPAWLVSHFPKDEKTMAERMRAKLLRLNAKAQLVRMLAPKQKRALRQRRLLAEKEGLDARRWTPKEESLLGTMSDLEVAAQLGRSVRSVATRRRERGIMFTKVSSWRPEEDKLLGTRHDRDVGQLLGRPATQIRKRRRRLGIPCLRVKVGWEEHHLALLGTNSDEEVARLTGYRPKTVEKKRQACHIPKFGAKPRWTPAENGLLGRMTDDEVAKRTGRSRSSVRIRRWLLKIEYKASQMRPWTKEEEEVLGTMRDEDAARKLKRTVFAVANWRTGLHIPIFAPKHRIWTAEEIARLGRFPDEVLAHQLNVAVRKIKGARNRFGIGRFTLKKPGGLTLQDLKRLLGSDYKPKLAKDILKRAAQKYRNSGW